MLDDPRFERVAFVLDITDRKQAEDAVIRGEKLAGFGRMVRRRQTCGVDNTAISAWRETPLSFVR